MIEGGVEIKVTIENNARPFVTQQGRKESKNESGVIKCIAH